MGPRARWAEVNFPTVLNKPPPSRPHLITMVTAMLESGNLKKTRRPALLGHGVVMWTRTEGFLIASGDLVSRRSLGAMEERRGDIVGFSLSRESESASSFHYCCFHGFYSVLDEDLCRKRSQ